METTQTKSQADDAAADEDVFQERCLAFLLSLPWRQRGFIFEWPVTDAVAKSVCQFLNAPIDDRQLESFVAKHPISESGWRPADLLALACHLNIRIQAPGEVSND